MTTVIAENCVVLKAGTEGTKTPGLGRKRFIIGTGTVSADSYHKVECLY